MPDGEETGLSLFGVKLSGLPKWVLGAVALLFAGVFAYLQLYNPQVALVTEKEANAALQLSVFEYGKHIAEAPETTASLLNDVRGQLSVVFYHDGCIVITRRDGERVWSKLIPDLARDKDHAPHFSLWQLVEPVVFAANGGGCLNPHPCQPHGPDHRCFDTRYGQRNGCWVEVWRWWPDGCEHVQMLDSCHGIWDANPDGSPRVRWTRCIH